MERLRIEQAINTNNKYLFRVLDTNGDGTGTKAAIGDYSITPATFFIQPPAGQIYQLCQFTVHVGDVGNFDPGSYGAGIVLTNGITVKIKDGSGDIVDLMDGLPILENDLWGHLCPVLDYTDYGTGADENFYRYSVNFPQIIGRPLVLEGDNGEYFEVRLNDDFTGLAHHHFVVAGFYHNVYI